jgi:hypothetical protein
MGRSRDPLSPQNASSAEAETRREIGGADHRQRMSIVRIGHDFGASVQPHSLIGSKNTCSIPRRCLTVRADIVLVARRAGWRARS